jgi:hypothetical protein
MIIYKFAHFGEKVAKAVAAPQKCQIIYQIVYQIKL